MNEILLVIQIIAFFIGLSAFLIALKTFRNLRK
jgi:nitrogen fixation-related uncharacterized protein